MPTSSKKRSNGNVVYVPKGEREGTAKGSLDNLNNIEISDKIKQNKKFEESLNLINSLAGEYNTRLGRIDVGAEKGAGDVQMSGYLLRLNSGAPEVAIHEFAHTMANSTADKYGLTNDKEFWKEIRKIRNAYHRDVDKKQDVKRWISTYEHSHTSVDEFFCEAFAHAKMKQMGMTPQKKYGTDYTYSNKVLETVDKYFKKK